MNAVPNGIFKSQNTEEMKYTQLFTLFFALFLSVGMAQAQNKVEKAPTNPQMKEAMELVQFVQKVNLFNKAFEEKDEQKVMHFKKAIIADMKREINQNREMIGTAGQAMKKRELIQESDDDNYTPAKGANETQVVADGKTTATAAPQPAVQRSLQSVITMTAKQGQILKVFEKTNFTFDKKNELATSQARELLQDFVSSMRVGVPAKMIQAVKSK